MATITQVDYLDRPPVGMAGQIADLTDASSVSRVAEDATLAFGVAVIQGTADRHVKVGAGGAFIGVTLLDKTLLPEPTVDTYVQNNGVNVLIRGAVFVKAVAAVAAGDVVHYTATGTLTNTGGTLVPNARWETTTAANGIGIVRLR